MPRLFFLIFILFINIASCFKSYAQIINIDKTDTSAYEKKSQWNASFSVGIEVDKQKTTLLDASNFADVSLQHYHELFIVSASNRITSNGNKSFLNTGYMHIRWRHDYKNRLHPESYGQYQWDDQRGMLHRFVSGANLRYGFWHHKNGDMTFATGVMYENEAWDYAAVDSSKIPANPVSQKTSVVKSNNYVKWEERISTNSDLSIILFYQALYTHFFQPRISTFISYDASISKHFSLGVKYNALNDVKPIVPIPHFYYSLSTNLSYKL